MQLTEQLKKTGLFFVNQQGMTPEQAVRELMGMGIPAESAQSFATWHREQARANERLTPPDGVSGLRYLREIQNLAWDPGQQDNIDIFWPALRPVIEQKVGEEGLRGIDEATDVIRRNCAPPFVHGSSRRGLVVGYVQSGKTANYTALMAKAADAGYRGFIVLSGIHNALRLQTQQRIQKDLVWPSNAAAGGQDGAPSWHMLTQTDPDEDFRPIPDGIGLLRSKELRLLAVVKKNPSRLRHLRRWLREMPDDVRRRCPFLIIDDEADQATPNTGRAGQQASTINALLRDVFGLLPTSTYVGYTATPFANVLIDPSASEDFYPRDFIVSLPRPKGYFGAEALFGSTTETDAELPDDGFDLVRNVPELEEEQVRPPSNREERDQFLPPVPKSMADAIRWFLMATATRRWRGQSTAHSSMLIHTTQYAAVHFAQAEAVRGAVDAIRTRVESSDGAELDDLEKLWIRERDRLVPQPGDLPSFAELVTALPDVLADVKTIVDNGSSDDRLDYTETTVVDGVEVEVPQTVIAVGGNTLSRGLTLEGLVVSYFVRSASSYDALLQMGRWFGFRPGYADLARVWMPAELSSNFRFLAGVEAEIREDIEKYGQEGMSPQVAGVRVRRHPAMAITSRLKMQFAKSAEISYAGERRQTFMFNRHDDALLRRNIESARRLLAEAGRSTAPRTPGQQRWIFDDVPSSAVEDFIDDYEFHPHHTDMDSGAIIDFLHRWDVAGYPVRWNVAVIGSSKTTHDFRGTSVDLGHIDIGLGTDVGLVNRSRLKDSTAEDMANIKSLMSSRDRVVDLIGLEPGQAGGKDADLQALRRQLAPGVGLLVLYPISKDSVPLSRSEDAARTRTGLEAAEHLIGVGLVFPDPPADAPKDLLTSEYVQVDLSSTGEDHVEQDEDEWELAGEVG